MAKKKSSQAPPAPVKPVPAPQPTSFTNVLIDWRFNLILIGVMEVLLILFALPRELLRYRLFEGQRALWHGDWSRASTFFYELEKQDRNNPGYLKAMGDVALGRHQVSRALEHYQKADRAGYSAPDLNVQAARACYEMAVQESDPKRQQEYLSQCQRLFQIARQQAPNDLKTNYWMGWFAQNARDYIAAADFFSRVRADALPPGYTPNEEQADLIKRAQENLAQIRTTVFEGKDYALNLSGLEIKTTPTLTVPTAPPVPPFRPPAVMTPLAAVQTPASPTPSVAPKSPAATPTPAAVQTPAPPTPPAATKTPLVIAPAVRPPAAEAPPAKTPAPTSTPGAATPPAPTPPPKK